METFQNTERHRCLQKRASLDSISITQQVASRIVVREHKCSHAAGYDRDQMPQRSAIGE
jgi:hypothetical protein